VSAIGPGQAAADGAPAPRPKLIFVRSETSGRSRRAEGYLAQVLQRRGNHDTFELVWVEADRQPELAARLGAEAVPTLIVVEGRHISARLSAPGGSRDIREFLAPWLK
jgi:thioredoxin-like negative regulator of GroEL